MLSGFFFDLMGVDLTINFRTHAFFLFKGIGKVLPTVESCLSGNFDDWQLTIA